MYIYICVCVYIYIDIKVSMYVCMYVCMHACMYVCVHLLMAPSTCLCVLHLSVIADSHVNKGLRVVQAGESREYFSSADDKTVIMHINNHLSVQKSKQEVFVKDVLVLLL